ncbi:hypothetical protein [Photobacterium leiognathi]|uniref:hypothetical protein n=1 Tax=Photobacterium leiognathi TaxID=553611 RepID=UPI0027368E14|nr:hypothetical protein [Photobacterium leiognathi]
MRQFFTYLMTFMMAGYLTFLVPALFGAQLILTIVLTKGEICPGQRGRIHKMLPVLLVGWLVAAIAQPLAVLPLLALAFFTMKVKTGKTRDAGPIKVLYGSDVLAFVCWLVLLPTLNMPEIAISLVAIALYGSALAHVLLTFARTRLQAFHRILPFVGFISAILTILFMIWQIMTLGQVKSSHHMVEIITALALMVIGLVIWAGHILLNKKANNWQLATALVVLVFSSGLQLVLF